MEIVKTIITDILIALYQPFLFSILLAVFFMFTYKQYSSIKVATKQWIVWFKTEKEFRKMFFLVFYTVMILFQTLLNRNMWENPVSNVIGIWGLYKESNGETVLTTEVPENMALFIPFTVLLLWSHRERLFSEVKLGKVLWQSTKITFMFSFTIEMLQLFLRLGTWQLSDLFYNTLGGLIGGVIYWIAYKVKHGRT